MTLGAFGSSFVESIMVGMYRIRLVNKYQVVTVLTIIENRRMNLRLFEFARPRF